MASFPYISDSGERCECNNLRCESKNGCESDDCTKMLKEAEIEATYKERDGLRAELQLYRDAVNDILKTRCMNCSDFLVEDISKCPIKTLVTKLNLMK